MTDKERIKELEEIIKTIYSQCKDGKLNQNWIGWKLIERIVKL